MKTILCLVGAVALVSTAPAFAKPGHGNNGKHSQHGYGDVQRGYGYAYGYPVNCPPGLAKKHNGCLPPGQAKKLYNVGQRLPYDYNGYTPYSQIPYGVRSQYDLDPYGRYIYDNNYLYRVDPTTQIISQVLSAILR